MLPTKKQPAKTRPPTPENTDMDIDNDELLSPYEVMVKERTRENRAVMNEIMDDVSLQPCSHYL